MHDGGVRKYCIEKHRNNVRGKEVLRFVYPLADMVTSKFVTLKGLRK